MRAATKREIVASESYQNGYLRKTVEHLCKDAEAFLRDPGDKYQRRFLRDTIRTAREALRRMQ